MIEKIFSTILLVILSFSVYADVGGKKIMDKNELNIQLNRIDENDEEALENLSQKVLKEVRTPLEAIIRIWSLPDKNSSAKAAFMIDELGELAIGPLLTVDTSKDVPKQIWRISAIVEAELALRTKIAAHLDKLLDDKTPVPMPDFGPIEEPPPPRRVCDEAYTAMRQLLNVTESREQQFMNIEEFLHLPDKEKDAEISKVRKLKKWTEFLEDAE